MVPKYDALPYVWRDPTDKKPIEIDGKEFHVTRNLHDALPRIRAWPYGSDNSMISRLRLWRYEHAPLDALWHRAWKDRQRSKPQWIWIDGICINQSDIAERGEHVQQTADIYKSASRVIIWLGEEDAAIKRATKRLKRNQQDTPLRER